MITLKRRLWRSFCYNDVNAKKENNPKLNKTVVWLFVAAIVLELINIIYCVSVSSEQANACPRDIVPGQASIALAITSAVIALAAVLFTKREKILVFFFALFHIVVVGCAEFFLLYEANGGLNWCNYVF